MLNLATLNPQQREAVETLEGPLLILAGAGTGKTRVITFRMANLMGHGVSPENILGVTFTNKAAREMLERVQALLPSKKKGAERPTICTFHSLCVKILRQHIHHLGYKPTFVIYDESEQTSLLKKAISSISAGKEISDPGEILNYISRFKNTGETVWPIQDGGTVRVLESIFNRYQSSLKACNAVDFDDLINLTLKLFNEHPTALQACRELYRYVMVDEYQDTNSAQFKLVFALTNEHQNLCVVGDDDQSIYGWRGAEIANLLELEKYFPRVKVIKLEQNYRSTSTILSLANGLIKNNARRRSKVLWSQNGQGTKVVLHTFSNDEEEAKTIAEMIEYDRIAHMIGWKEQAILFRTNLQSRPIETALRAANIRYHLIGGQSFFDRREIRDFVAYLKTFINPHDDISLLRIANVPARGLSDVTMERLISASQERQCSVFTTMRHTDVLNSFQAKTRESIFQFLEFIEHQQRALENLPQDSMRSWAEAWLDKTGYLEDLRKQDKDSEVAENRIANLRELAISMDKEDYAAPKAFQRLQLFLETVSLDNDRFGEKENAGDAVTLITMHSCKGLEFPHVFVVGLEDGLLPHTRSKVEGTVDEERRLFYVAITRAMKTLNISHCESRKKYGKPIACHVSPFLNELPHEFLEHSNAKSKKPVTVETGKNFFAAMRNATGS
jgi:superfamily I DNA/RNA helicase